MYTHQRLLAITAAFIFFGCAEEDEAIEPTELRTPNDYRPEVLRPFDSGPADIDVTEAGEAFTLTAYNALGDSIAKITLEQLGDGVYRVESSYADGSGVVVVDANNDTIVSSDQTLDSEVMVERAALIGDLVGVDPADPQEYKGFDGWGGCGAGLVWTAINCIPHPVNLWGVVKCPLTAAGATCACIKAANNGKAKKPCGKAKHK